LTWGETLGATNPAGAELKTVVVAQDAVQVANAGFPKSLLWCENCHIPEIPLSELKKIISESVLRSVIFRRD
jgi:hypothetical protein